MLVAGGAGAVGNAAIQLARWAGATVVTTVSSPEKAALATDAGAHYVINYRDNDAAEVIRSVAPGRRRHRGRGRPARECRSSTARCSRPGGVVAMYSRDADPTHPVRRRSSRCNTRWQGVLVYTVPRRRRKITRCRRCARPSTYGAIRVGADAGLPLHHFPLADDGRGA